MRTIFRIKRGMHPPKLKEIQINKRSILLLICVSLFFNFSLYAQESLTVSGIITDMDDIALPGVAVILKGTTNGTITGMDGKYTIANVPADGILVFSFIGMLSEDISVDGQTKIDLTMIPDIESIDEVITIGYGVSTKRKLTGSVSSITTEDMEQVPMSTVSEVLQGRVAGVNIDVRGGEPGKVPSISIRGAGNPLYVIDGVIMEGDFAFSTLNINDIESISFLKDASATAVYGSRAGNGIVLVTTKRGQEGKMNINYSYDHQWSTPTYFPENISSYEWAKIQNEGKLNDGLEPTFADEELQKYMDQSDPYYYPNSNWGDLLLNKYANSNRHNLSLSGGNEKTNYFVSFGYFDQGDISKAQTYGLERMNIRSNVSSSFDKIGLTIGVNLSGSLQKVSKSPSAADWDYMGKASPATLAYNPDGTVAAGTNHPLAFSNKEAGYNKNREKNINAQLTAKWEVPKVKGLSLGTMVNYSDGDYNTKIFNHYAPQYNLDGTLFPTTKPSLAVESGYGHSYYLEGNINYLRSFGKHTVEGTFVANQSEYFRELVYAERKEYPSSAVDQLFAGPNQNKGNDGRASAGASIGYVGRLKYDYAAKYILEFSFRYDGNDNFAPEQRWGFFPSGSLAWIVSDENFMQGLKDRNILNLLKLRGSSGQTGLTAGTDRHGYLFNYSIQPYTFVYGSDIQTGYHEGNLVDPESLTWYTLNTSNVGFDFASLNNKLEGGFDYFYNETTGYIVSPKNTGYTETLGKALPKVKSNSVKRRAGFEAILSYKGRITNDFSFKIGANLSYYNSLWEQKDDEPIEDLMNPDIRVTHQTDVWGRCLNSNGLYQTPEEVINNPRMVSSVALKPGDISYVDFNGDGVIDSYDEVRQGLPAAPHTYYGITLDLDYKGIFLRTLITGTGDRYLMREYLAVRGEPRFMTIESRTDYWSPENTGASLPIVSSGGRNISDNNSIESSFFLENARYIRLKSMQLGYDFSNLLNDNSFLNRCTLILSGTNLLTKSDIKEWADPEGNRGNQGAMSGYPLMKTYSIALNIQF